MNIPGRPPTESEMELGVLHFNRFCEVATLSNKGPAEVILETGDGGTALGGGKPLQWLIPGPNQDTGGLEGRAPPFHRAQDQGARLAYQNAH